MRDRWLWIGCLLYAMLFMWLGWVKYAAHRNLVDFGIFAQTTTSAFGCFCNTVEGSHWAFHFSPILYAVGAVVAIAKSPVTLIALQSIACALTAPPIYAIVRSRAGVTTARLAALVVFLYPPLAGLAFVDFHENAFAPASVAWALWAFDAGLLGIAAIATALALAVKEDQGIFLALSGMIGAIAYERKDRCKALFAVVVACVGALTAGTFFFVIQTHAALGNAPNAAMHWQPARFYDWSGSSLRAIFPGGFVGRLGFLLLAFAPLAFVPFRSRWLILAIAPIAEVLFSRMPTTYAIGTHYAGAWIGYVLIAFAIGIRDAQPQWKPQRALAWAIALSALTFVVADPLHPGINLRAREPRDTALDTFLSSLPSNANIATQEEAYTHLALGNPRATVFPELASTPLTACYALTDTAFQASPRMQEYGPAMAGYERSGTYVIARRAGSVTLFRSTTCP